MSFDEMLKNAIDDAVGTSTPCPIESCDGKVKPHTLFESFCALLGYPVINDTNRPWIADVPGSQNGEYLG